MADKPESSEEQAIVPIREAQVEFYGDTLIAVEAPDGVILVPLRPICEYLGLSWNGQRERARRNPALADALRFARLTKGGLNALHARTYKERGLNALHTRIRA